MIENYFTCPNCLQQISILVDPSLSEQNYIEDCEVCCNPLNMHITIENGEITSFDAELAQ